MKKFKESDYEKLVELGSKMLPLSMCGSSFNLTSAEFVELYQADRNAQIAFEGGRANKVLEKLEALNEQTDLNSIKAMLAMADTKEELKKSGSISVVEKKVARKKNGLEHLTDPSLLKNSFVKGVPND